MRDQRRLIGLLGLATSLMGCGSLPEHTNTVFFGTSTRVGVDIGADSMTAATINVGYKRHEYLIMPLLANQAKHGHLKGLDVAGQHADQGSNSLRYSPAKCTRDYCREFEATSGNNESFGHGARDIYSVLATFSGDVTTKAGAGVVDGIDASTPTTGTKPRAEVGAHGAIVQYFATGLAARALASNPMASAVNTAAVSGTGTATTVRTTQDDKRPKAAARANAQALRLRAVLTHLAPNAQSVDAEKRKRLLHAARDWLSSPPKELCTTNDLAALRSVLSTRSVSLVDPLYFALQPPPTAAPTDPCAKTGDLPAVDAADAREQAEPVRRDAVVGRVTDVRGELLLAKLAELEEQVAPYLSDKTKQALAGLRATDKLAELLTNAPQDAADPLFFALRANLAPK